MKWHHCYNNKNDNNNNNNNNNNNKSTDDNKVNSFPWSPTSKETVGESMVKKLNGFLLTRKLNHKCLVRVRPFNSDKLRYMHDHAKATV